MTTQQRIEAALGYRLSGRTQLICQGCHETYCDCDCMGAATPDCDCPDHSDSDTNDILANLLMDEGF